MYLVSVYPTDKTLATYINSGQDFGEGGVKKKIEYRTGNVTYVCPIRPKNWTQSRIDTRC